MKKGFTLLELLIVIAILAVMAAVVVLTLNPAEHMRKARDSQRMADLNAAKTAILLLQNSTTTFDIGLASCSSTPCSSDSGSAANSGGGWMHIDFTDMVPAPLSNLPMDPTNSGNSIYKYQVSGDNFEINAVLESGSNSGLMANDGGDESGVYEVGTVLTIISP